MGVEKQTLNRRGTLGTFAGVFTPSILTILGIILFLRLGVVVGSAGLGKALVIIAIANLISVLTTFSLAAIATNLTVKGGGDYYLISRTLGVEFGGAIGIVLFLAQSISIAFYCIGFGEALAGIMNASGAHFPQYVAAIAVGLLFVLAWKGADWATKFQYVVMAFLTLALISVFVGGLMRWDSALLAANWGASVQGPGFWALFAIFFPAVTGFTQGVSMSGDLEDPGRSLPVGTFLAVAVSIGVYFSVAVILAASVPAATLAGDSGAMKQAAFAGVLVDAGVIAATLSSAMASFMGAPRILQSLSSDRIFPFLAIFAKGHGPQSNPRNGVLLSLAIALITIALGQLDLVAGIVSMFFLISYGLLNYATYFEARMDSPSFRPRFRWYHYRISLLGFMACLAVMIAIDIKVSLVAGAVLVAIHQYLKRTAGPARWADGLRSWHLKQVRDNLMAAAKTPEHPRDWRPVILVVSESDAFREPLIHFSGWVEGGSGMTTAVRIVSGQGLAAEAKAERIQDELRKSLLSQDHPVFSRVVTARDAQAGLVGLVQAMGLGPVRINTAILNWQEYSGSDIPGESPQGPASLKSLYRNRCNLVLFKAGSGQKGSPGSDLEEKRYIDVWWQGDATSHLMVLLAHLIARHSSWQEASIRVFALNYDADTVENREALSEELEEIRISAEPVIVLNGSPAIVETKAMDADLVFLPFWFGAHGVIGPGGHPLDGFMRCGGTVAAVMASEKIDLDAQPEEGDVQTLTRLMDDLEHALKRASGADEEAAEIVALAREKMDAIRISGGLMGDAQMESLKQALDARSLAEEAIKKASRERAKARMALDAAREAGLVNDPGTSEYPGDDSGVSTP